MATIRNRIANWLAPVMFALSLLFLALVAALSVLWIDVPRVVETLAEPDSPEMVAQAQQSLTMEEIRFELSAYRWGLICGGLLLLIWPVFILEQLALLIVHGSSEDRARSFSSYQPLWWVFCILPPLRMCARHRERKDYIWFPRKGWCEVDWILRRDLERAFSIPMIWIALLILPVLGLQFYFKERIVEYPNLRIALHFGTGLIWFAFATEFIVMVSVAEKKLDYCKKHWLDLIIILLPLISFLRTLRLLRATRLVKLGKVQQLSRVVRVYRLRGVAMRALRALMLLDVAHRILRLTPEKRLKKLQDKHRDKARELKLLEFEMQQLCDKYDLQSEPMDSSQESSGSQALVESERSS